MTGAAPSTWPDGATVIESDPVRILHRGRLHIYVNGHMRGGSPVQPHWRPAPQGTAPATNPEPVELFGGKTSAEQYANHRPQ